MRARRRFGQHFLEPAWVDKVVSCIAPRSSDRMLEIGPGRGALTCALAPRVASLVGVEIDRDLALGLGRRLPGHVRIVPGDFLDMDVSALLGPAAGAGAVRVVGNLPYNISSPILFRLLEIQRRSPVFSDATVMVQREVADRVAAREGSRESGVLSVMVQLEADVERLLALPPGAFRPAPEVSSALVRLRFRPPVVTLRNRAGFEALVRGLFTHRRKTLANALKPMLTESDLSAAAILSEVGIDPMRRPETLHLAELARLADALDAGHSRPVV
jgi:16S rRNA (adenine1518-N6/adenine1519-N6)-dimethyltransferase